MLKGCLIAVGVGLVLVVALFVFVFAATSGAADAADSFLALIAEGKTKEAYESTAPAFRDATSEAEFVAFAEKLGLPGYESASWTSRHVKNNTAQVGGTVKTKSGSVALTVDLVKLDGGWKVLGFKTTSDAGTPPELKVPPLPELERLAQQSVTMLDAAVRAADFTPFHQGVARRWQAQTTPQELQAAFQGFIDRKTDLSAAGTVAPTFGKPPAIDNGVLVLEGAFPTQPKEIVFELKYLYEHPAWKLAGINVSTR